MTDASAGGALLTPEEAAALAAKLVWEMIQRWRQGERPLPEQFLARHPGLWQHPEAAADLIYEELCLRQEHGPEVPVEQVLRRFPQWRPQLEVLFDCQRVLGPRRPAPQFPAAGESLGDFLLLAELGGGAQGRVFLARQRGLGDRPVVVKLTPAETREHLALARLQHTHIVPLYSVQDHLERGLLALCMPYFGGSTLDRLLAALSARRTGQDLLDALDRAVGKAFQPDAPNSQAFQPDLRERLSRLSYVQAICWVGACLADALQYAHERGLVHLDVKPSNVLLAADGTPMLLDFHLAREPIHPDGEWPEWLGGTPGYMAPEHQAALAAVQHGRPVPGPVDGRADVYSLGVVLYEALGGNLPLGSRHLRRASPQVSVGLTDVVGKCLAADPARRYPDMAALAADLRRHLAHLPLAGVRNRSLAERWRKWRQRRPHGLARAGMLLAVLTAAAAVALGAATDYRRRVEQARAALDDGQAQLARGEWDGAARTLRRGLSAARATPFRRDLADELNRRLCLAERGRAAADRDAAVRELHRLTDRLRFLYAADPIPHDVLQQVEPCCRALWDSRGRIVERLGRAPPAVSPRDREAPNAVRDDLLDLAILWADVRLRLADAGGKGEARGEALAVLAQAEELFGPSPVLDAERQLHEGRGARVRGPGGGTAWEHYALARALLRPGDVDRAAAEAEAAVRLRPQDLWPNFYHGLCAYRRGRYPDAVAAFSVCVGAAPEPAACFANRGLALAALGRTEQARHDYEQALRLDPTLAAAVSPGMSRYRAGRDSAPASRPASR
jgi:serine/threonine protein kinase